MIDMIEERREGDRYVLMIARIGLFVDMSVDDPFAWLEDKLNGLGKKCSLYTTVV